MATYELRLITVAPSGNRSTRTLVTDSAEEFAQRFLPVWENARERARLMIDSEVRTISGGQRFEAEIPFQDGRRITALDVHDQAAYQQLYDEIWSQEDLDTALLDNPIVVRDPERLAAILAPQEESSRGRGRPVTNYRIPRELWDKAVKIIRLTQPELLEEVPAEAPDKALTSVA